MSIELPKAYDPTDVEKRWYPFWEQKGYFTADASATKPHYSIILPPPNVTGSLHLGHALTATIQDVLCRWKRMSGYTVLWLPGTDHAGIATQMVVEKELKATEHKSRHDLGRAAFLERVWAWKEKYGARIGEQHKVLGASLDWSRERFTMDERSSRAVVEAFVRLHEEGLIYRDNKLINWCPSCLTALSDLEVEHEEKEGSIWEIAYPVKGTDQKLIVATTRPETMLGDTAVAIHPNDPRYLSLHGGVVVLPLLDREIPIILDAQLVSMEFGTGAVKVTPAHDPNDYATALRQEPNLPMISIFDERAKVNENGGPYQGLDRYEARKKVLEDLQAKGLLVKEDKHKLAIGACQRCGTVVEPRLSRQWFVKVGPLAKAAITAVEQERTRFVPETWRNTFFSWMRNIHDWCISRQLWWGHQIPAWYPANSPRLADGSIDFSSATPVVSRTRPDGDWVQDPDVLDTWFSSGLWPFSTLGWPGQTEDLREFYPTNVLETGHDIIFFWVARMMMMGLHFMKDVPFRVVYLHAMVRDEKGEKMSKTKGNVIDPLHVVRGAKPDELGSQVRARFKNGMEAQGADALRFTLAALTQQGRDIKLSIDRIRGYREFLNKLWNAARFAFHYLGDYQADAKHIAERRLSLPDRWILSRLNRTIQTTQESLQAFQLAEAASTLYQFVWREFCDWYIELSKPALQGEDKEAADAARAVLVHCLDRICRLLHPFIPFITEELWQKLPMQRPTESIMVASYPEADRRLDDPAAEAEMSAVITAIEGIRRIRGESDIGWDKKLEAHVQTDDKALQQSLTHSKAYLTTLAGLSALHVGPVGTKPPQSAAEIAQGMEIYVPLAGVVDLTEERQRLAKEIGKAENEAQGIQKRLDNKDFVARAPPEVVTKDRARVDELKARVGKLHENLKRIAPLEVRIAPPAGGAVDLSHELKDELAQVEVPNPDQQVKEALDKLREGTKEGLTSRDRVDLGVAYLNMGLVDDAVREFNKAKEGEEKPPEDSPGEKTYADRPSAKLDAAAKAKKPAARAKKAPAKKPAAKAKKAAPKAKKLQKKPSKPAPKGKKPAKKKR